MQSENNLEAYTHAKIFKEALPKSSCKQENDWITSIRLTSMRFFANQILTETEFLISLRTAQNFW